MVAMAESVQEQGLSAGMSELSKEHGEAVGSRAKPDAVTRFRGVHRQPSGRYRAQIWVPWLRANVRVGTFDTSEEAAKAYDAAAVELAEAKKNKAAAVELKACTPRWAAKKKRAAARARLDAWTEFRGVYRMPNGKYGAHIRNSRAKARTWLGTFDAAEDAARAYDDAAVKLHGTTAVTNFNQPREDRDATAESTTVKKKKAARQDARTKFRGVYRTARGKYGARIEHSKTRTWLGTFVNVEEAARAYDAAAVKLLGAAAKTNFEQPPTGAAAGNSEESPTDLLNEFLEMPAVGFLSRSFVSGAQLDDLSADLPPAERQLGDEFIKDDRDFSDVVP